MPGCTAQVPLRALQCTRQHMRQRQRQRMQSGWTGCAQQQAGGDSKTTRGAGRQAGRQAGRRSGQAGRHPHTPVSEATALWMSSASSPLCSPPAMAAITALCRERSNSCGAGGAGRQAALERSHAWRTTSSQCLAARLCSQQTAVRNEAQT